MPLVPTPPIDLAREAFLGVIRLHEKLTTEAAEVFARHDVTAAWFNVMRILIGGTPAGVSCQYVGERLLHRLPDVTRLIDRMEAAGLVTRERSTEDRRVVTIRITKKGRTTCEALREPIDDLHRRQFAHLSRTALEQLVTRLQNALDRP